MSHTLLHQFLVSDLVVPVGLAQAPGHECLTRFGACLTGGTWLRPDLMVFRREQAERGLPHIKGAPTLAVEVVSPASRAADLRAKRELYARNGVQAYWVVDAGDGRPDVIVHELAEDGRYAVRERVPWGASRRLSRPFPIELAPEEIFRPPGRTVPTRRAAMPDLPNPPDVPAAGPDLPGPGEPIPFDVFGSRWPTGAEKAELWNGCPVFYGEWDERDVEIAERAYPGRAVRLDQPPGEPGTMTILPVPGEQPETRAGGPPAARTVPDAEPLVESEVVRIIKPGARKGGGAAQETRPAPGSAAAEG